MKIYTCSLTGLTLILLACGSNQRANPDASPEPTCQVCDPNASCQADECVCDDGFMGDGELCEDVAPPVARLTFPSHLSFTSETSVTLYGTANDNIAVDSLTVNGTDATSSDGFATWTATIPLSEDTERFEIVAQDEAGNVSGSIVGDVQRPPDGFFSYNRFVFDASENRIFAASRSEIYEIDLDDQSGRLITQQNVITGLIYDSTRNRLLFGAGGNGVRQIDLGTDQIDSFSTATIPNADNPSGYIRSIAISGDGTSLVIGGDNGMFKTDLATGARTPIPGATEIVQNLLLNQDGTNLYFVDDGSGPFDDSIRARAVADGTLTILAANQRGVAAPTIVGNTIYFSRIDNQAPQIASVDTTTLALTPVLAVSEGSPVAMSVGQSGEILLGYNQGPVGFQRLELATLAREWLLSDLLPRDAWIAYADPDYVSDAVDGKIYAPLRSSRNPHEFVSLDLMSGEQRLLRITAPQVSGIATAHGLVALDSGEIVLFDCTLGNGDVYVASLTTLVAELRSEREEGGLNACPNSPPTHAGNLLFLINGDEELIRVDLTSGDRSKIDISAGPGPTLDSLYEVTPIPGEDSLIVVGRFDGGDAAIEIDLSGGTRKSIGMAPNSKIISTSKGLYQFDSNLDLVRIVRDGEAPDTIPMSGVIKGDTDGYAFAWGDGIYFIENSGRVVGVRPETHETSVMIECLGSRCASN